MGAIPNAVWRLVLFQFGSRIIAALLARAPFIRRRAGKRRIM